MVMKLVMVDPSKSRKDKVRSNTFHHFKNQDVGKNFVKMQGPNMKVPIIFHKFEQNYSESVIGVDEYGNDIDSKAFRRYKHNVPDTTTTRNPKKTNISTLSEQKFNNESSLVIKIDPKYKSTIDNNSFNQFNNRHQASPSHHIKSNNNIHNNNQNLSNTHNISRNKIKKVTFVRNTDKNSTTLIENSELINASDETIPNTITFPIDLNIKRTTVSVIGGLQYNGAVLPSENNLGNLHKDAWYAQSEIPSGDKTEKSTLTGKFNSDTKIKLNRSQPNVPTLKGYSTYTFKVNLKENETGKE